MAVILALPIIIIAISYVPNESGLISASAEIDPQGFRP